jgi:hypothetical protein
VITGAWWSRKAVRRPAYCSRRASRSSFLLAPGAALLLKRTRAASVTGAGARGSAREARGATSAMRAADAAGRARDVRRNILRTSKEDYAEGGRVQSAEETASASRAQDGGRLASFQAGGAGPAGGAD